MVELSHLLEIMTDMFCTLNKDKEGKKITILMENVIFPYYHLKETRIRTE